MQRIEELYNRYLDNTISDSEKQELFRLMREADDERLAELADSYLQEQEPEDLTYLQPDTDRILHGIKEHIARQERQSGKTIPLRRIITVAATAVLIGLVAYYIYKTSNDSQQQPIASIYGEDVAPGSNKATITLSDGTVVELDQNQSGVIANGTNLSYADGGQVVKAAPEVEHATLSTPRGGQYQLTLPDGSKVWLNAASSITYPTKFEGKQRIVKLQGEAYFDVTTNQTKPFIVESKDQQVMVTGTEFNISTYADEPTSATTLIEGKVQIIDSHSGKTTTLAPGQQAISGGNGIEIQTVDTDVYTAWKDNYFVFESMEIHAILRQLSRWYDVQVDYTDIPNETLSARVRRDKNISSVLTAISKTTGLDFYISERRMILRK